MMEKILVICEGNICRSPMVQALLSVALPEVKVTSAGLGALVGMQADPHAIDLMAQRGVDLSLHVARQFSWAMAKDADLIFAMDSGQKKAAESAFPFVSGKVFRLGEHSKIDVLDPYRKGLAAFEQALAAIDRGILDWLPALKKLTK
ncbi:low molecular weight protein-tyrosine-phosphatase [Paraburkholderia aspalathi]|uniref:protein-tyrosine-phosphatase n=1 Tax=Paraburkholderia aspalathi TaxID=1324617 RepID=A0A1I7E7Y7_9BURK|nr:low molecular weight protein-tyrosine-phosphatase [Paraburkholderia aspalathi]SFU20041.1 protein tyrosine phosphatase [Paraburkholderia aspalathi]